MSVQTPSVAVVENPVQSAIDAFKSGQDVRSAVYGGEAATPEPDDQETQEASSDDSSSEESTQESTSEDGQEASASPSKTEKLTVTGPDGRKQEVEIDWNDKEKLKKYIHAAAGMRKFQAERDTAKKSLQELQANHKDLADSWDAVKQAYSTQGVRGLVNLLQNDGQAYDKLISQEMQRSNQLANATPEERSRMELEQQLQTERQERARLMKSMEENTKKQQDAQSVAERRELESRIHPAFDRYRFTGKLGDPATETELDQTLWARTLERLGQYPEDQELSADVVDKEFRTVANIYRNVIQKQGDKKASQVIAKKKVAAQENAAAKAMKGVRAPDADTEAFNNDIKSGNLTDALSRFFSGKVKV